MDKKELKKAAEQLATCAVILRQSAAKPEREKLYSEYEALLGKVNRLRSGIPELKGKRYWWDVPFREEGLLSGETACIADGIFSEQASLNETDCHPGMDALTGKTIKMPCSVAMEYRSTWKPLYLNKPELLAHLNDEIEWRAVYCASAEDAESGERAHAREADSLSSAILHAQNAARDTQARAERANKELPEKLAKHNDFWDTMERLSHQSFYTNEERWLMGKMDTSDYLAEDAGRFLRQRELEHKAWEKQMEAEHQARRLKNLRNLAQIREIQEAGRQEHAYSAMFCRAAEIAYCGEKLLAIYLPPKEQPVYEITAAHAVNPLRLEGTIAAIRELYHGQPDYRHLFAFLTERYAGSMKPCNVLSAKPKGLSDEEWRAWVEIRWMYKMMQEK